MDRRIREHIKEAERLGFRVVQITHGGKHPKLHVTDGTRCLKVTMPSSGSDQMGIWNWVARLRRQFGLRGRMTNAA